MCCAGIATHRHTWAMQFQVERMKRLAESVGDQDWWWHTFLTQVIAKDMRQKSKHHKKPHWPTLQSYVNCENSY